MPTKNFIQFGKRFWIGNCSFTKDKATAFGSVKSFWKCPPKQNKEEKSGHLWAQLFHQHRENTTYFPVHVPSTSMKSFCLTMLSKFGPKYRGWSRISCSKDTWKEIGHKEEFRSEIPFPELGPPQQRTKIWEVVESVVLAGSLVGLRGLPPPNFWNPKCAVFVNKDKRPVQDRKRTYIIAHALHILLPGKPLRTPFTPKPMRKKLSITYVVKHLLSVVEIASFEAKRPKIVFTKLSQRPQHRSEF